MRGLTFIIAATFACALPAYAADAGDGAFHTRVVPREDLAGIERPAAAVAELAWLAGRWEGPGIGGAMAQETYSAPLGGMIAGHFAQAGEDGAITFYELIQIAPDEGSIVLRLKHFSGELIAWEEKDKMVRFPLIAREEGVWYFNGLTFRRVGPDRLHVAVRMNHKDGSQSELTFDFRRVG
jgi:hypothetical protein